jgi:hypothetical protein
MAIIDKPTDYFNTVLYTGNSNAHNQLQELGFNQILLGLKIEIIQIIILFDVVRGAT